MSTGHPRRPMGLLMRPAALARWDALSDTPVHAAATALVVAADRCPDPVRSRSVTSLFAVAADVESGDGDDARRRAGMVVALVESASSADPSCRPLVLALERWILHPGRDTAAELTGAAADFVADAPDDLRRRCWSVGAGLDAAVDTITEHGLAAAGDEVISAVAEACDMGVSSIWVAHRCGVRREALTRRLRDVRHRGGGSELSP